MQSTQGASDMKRILFATAAIAALGAGQAANAADLPGRNGAPAPAPMQQAAPAAAAPWPAPPKQ